MLIFLLFQRFWHSRGLTKSSFIWVSNFCWCHIILKYWDIPNSFRCRTNIRLLEISNIESFFQYKENYHLHHTRNGYISLVFQNINLIFPRMLYLNDRNLSEKFLHGFKTIWFFFSSCKTRICYSQLLTSHVAPINAYKPCFWNSVNLRDTVQY